MADGGWQQAGQRSEKVEEGTVSNKQRFGGNTIRFLESAGWRRCWEDINIPLVVCF